MIHKNIFISLLILLISCIFLSYEYFQQQPNKSEINRQKTIRDNKQNLVNTQQTIVNTLTAEKNAFDTHIDNLQTMPKITTTNIPFVTPSSGNFTVGPRTYNNRLVLGKFYNRSDKSGVRKFGQKSSGPGPPFVDTNSIILGENISGSGNWGGTQKSVLTDKLSSFNYVYDTADTQSKLTDFNLGPNPMNRFKYINYDNIRSLTNPHTADLAAKQQQLTNLRKLENRNKSIFNRINRDYKKTLQMKKRDKNKSYQNMGSYRRSRQTGTIGTSGLGVSGIGEGSDVTIDNQGIIRQI